MNKRDVEKDAERPHFYSMYWIEIAKAYHLGEEAGEVAALAPTEPELAPPPALDLLDEIPLPRVAAKPAKAKPTEPARASSLNSLADLAKVGFGADAETEDIMIDDDEDPEAVISRMGIGRVADDDLGAPPFREVEPDMEESASLEALSEEEDLFDDEEEEDDLSGGAGGHRRPVRPPAKPPRRPIPTRKPARDF